MSWADRTHTVEVACFDSLHRITWESGRITLEDHDVEAEQTLEAFGSRAPSCLRVLAAWRGAWTDVDAVALVGTQAIPYLRRAHAELNQTVMRLRSAGRAHPSQWPPNIREWADAYERQAAVVELPQQLRALLALSIDQGLGELRREDDGSPGTSLHTRVSEVLLDSLRQVAAPTAMPAVACFVVPAEVPRAVIGFSVGGEVGAAVFVSASWDAHVASRDLAVTDGHMVLDASATPDGLEALAVAWERDEPRVVHVRVGDGPSLELTGRDVRGRNPMTPLGRSEPMRSRAHRASRPAREPWMGPPNDLLPASLETSVLVARTDDVALSVERIAVYEDGFAFELAARTRRRIDRLWELVGRGQHNVDPEDALRLGLQFADGTLISEEGRTSHPPSGVRHLGGGGGEETYRDEHWVWPLPPPGPLTFIVAWGALGIPTTRAEIDGDEIRRAAARVRRLWD